MQDRSEKAKKHRTRVRETDFHTIENPPGNYPLSSYQLKVREKLAQSPSAEDGMIEQEEAPERKKADIQIRRRVMRKQRYAGLTAKQWECLKLRYHRYSKDPEKKDKEVPLTKIAKKLKITVSSVSSRMERALMKIEKLTIRQLEGKRIHKLIRRPLYRAKLRNVHQLYFEKLWPPKKIAKSLHSNLASIYKNIRTLRWLAHSYSPKEAALPEAHQYEDHKNQSKKIVVSVKKPSKKLIKWPK